MSGGSGNNTDRDRELWREPHPEGEAFSYYSPSIHVTQGGGIGINVGGTVHVMPLRDWHALAALRASPAQSVGVTLRALQAVHVERQEEWCPDQKPDLSFRGNELGGEAGEAQNVIKKLERERHGWRGSRDTVEHLAEELADVVHTAVLCAITAGIDLDAAVVAKFNATSEKNGLKARIRSALLPVAEAGAAAAWLVEFSEDGGIRRHLMFEEPTGHYRECATALYLHPAPSPAETPEGWVLVPKEPTEAMIEAGKISVNIAPRKLQRETPGYAIYLGTGETKTLYRAMIDASPTPTVEG